MRRSLFIFLQLVLVADGLTVFMIPAIGCYIDHLRVWPISISSDMVKVIGCGVLAFTCC
ncbi:hypothetical Protein YC6258_03680 [Gynuella sunshinyii YC6258]|uniref:Uncharacterized protein n=1 Tax=Gynuella sunshinyii YC6258 TaxID=1445510 RepID=A0A0C5VN37_9GAMM|nr:hypothetical Protein YC6258_03680 [Gynuella sunshinyii YC6258]